ncbi:DUF1648 domain-containing protein [Demequina globuliformis]|uniref:DUF1648 domain-containing protein n=1 Tax=Demequina globuliformis TaxID=676202 RepID=UPI001379197B|nr:DUF1648 domain-containing protein [Demequina globuliformis]
MSAGASHDHQPGTGPHLRGARITTYVLTGIGAIAALAFYPLLPDAIPIHWDATGTADSWGSPVMIVVLVALWVGIVIGVDALSRRPHILNYPMEVTKEAAPRLYASATRMLVWMNVGLTVLFGSLVLQSYGISAAVLTGAAALAILVALAVGLVRMLRVHTR